MIDAQNNHTYDITIIGAGINGASIALEATQRGYDVVLLEQYPQAAQGTSSKSSKLIHGGLRYLESMQFKLVQECLYEQKRLLQKYPELVKPQKFFIPVYQTSKRSNFTIRFGLCLYSLLGGLHKHNRFKTIDQSKWAILDGLDTSHLTKVFQYYDAQTDDIKLTQTILQQAQSNGAKIQYNCHFLSCDRSQEPLSIKYLYNDNEYTLHSKYLVNASGPWVNHIAQRCVPALEQADIDLVRGTHIELPKTLTQGIYYLEAPQDKRAIFLMPWNNHSLLGTTEVTHTDEPEHCHPSQIEIDYLLSIYNHYFPNDNYGHNDIIRAWAGLRVLPKTQKSFFDRNRDTFFVTDHTKSPKIISIYGGKLTSHYSTTLKALKHLKLNH